MPGDDKKQKIFNKLLTFFINYFFIITAASMVVLSGILLFFILIPKYKSVRNSIVIEKEKNSEETLNRKEYLNKLISEKSWFESLDKYDLAKLDDILPKKQNVAHIIKKLNLLAEKNNFILQDVKYVEDKTEEMAYETDGIKILKFNIKLSKGEYSDFKNFLNMVASDVNIMDVSSIVFKGTDYNFEIKTYYRE